MPPTGGKLAMIAVPPTERLPDGIGGPVLRAAALKGDPAAAYEVGVRFAEGKGVAPDLDQAAKWYDRAAQAGVVPALFRLGTFYEKGLSVKKDVEIARRYYLQAAERGSAKAMHNLAVLDADGGGKGANYKSASIWFRKAADRGVADSQFNLGILYARGIGVEQNLAESFKWFSLAAAQGDADAGRKRDDIAKRLDVQSLAAARLAIQTFTPEPQPDDAVNVASPAGGWDSAAAPATAKPGAKPARPSAPPPPITRSDAPGCDAAGIAAISSAINSYNGCAPARLPSGSACNEDRLSTEDNQDGENRFRRSPTGPAVAPPRIPPGQPPAPPPPTPPGGNGISGRSPSSSCWSPASAFAPTGTCRSRRPGTTGRTSTSRRA